MLLVARRGRGVIIIDSIDNMQPQVALCAPDCAVYQIAHPALEDLLVVANYVGVIIIGVSRKTPLESKEETHGINTEPINRKEWVHDIPGRFGHFFMVHGPMAVHKDITRKR